VTGGLEAFNARWFTGPCYCQVGFVKQRKSFGFQQQISCRDYLSTAGKFTLLRRKPRSLRPWMNAERVPFEALKERSRVCFGGFRPVKHVVGRRALARGAPLPIQQAEFRIRFMIPCQSLSTSPQFSLYPRLRDGGRLPCLLNQKRSTWGSM